MTAPRVIVPLQRRNAAPFEVQLPGSKSMTNRALVLGAMRMGTTEIHGGLDCDDTQRLAAALGAFGGLAVDAVPTGFRTVRSAARLQAPATAIDVGAAGTPARFLLAFAATAAGATVVTGSPRLRERPMGDLLAALRALGIRCECLQADDCLPVRVHGGTPASRHWRVGAGVSSQFTSALLLLASQCPGAPIELALDGEAVSQPYAELTRAMLAQCGIATERRGDTIVVQPAPPRCARIDIEPDASSMVPFLALAAVTGTAVTVPGIGAASQQADVGMLAVLERMGCAVERQRDCVRLRGAALRGVDVDMAAMPDAVLALAAVAAVAAGPTRIAGLATLRTKESDRIEAAATALSRLGQRVETGRDWLRIEPTGELAPASVPTHDDHRVAMAFAPLGLLRGGIAIEDPDCVAKSFPGFWHEFDRCRAHHDDAARA